MIRLRTLCIALLFVALASVAGCLSPLVGLECRPGHTRCGGACYDLRNDALHCGSCDLACGAAQSCVQNQCIDGPVGDGGPVDGGDGGDGDGGDGDGGVGDGGDGDGGDGDGGDGGDIDAGDGGDGGIPDDGGVPPDATAPPTVPCTGPGSPSDCACDLGQQKCGLTCVDALTDPANCGSCGTACLPIQVCATGSCAPLCGSLTMCGGICVDPDENVEHCGGCGTACAPGAACIHGGCVGSAVGHVVAIGHDMSGSRPPMDTLVGNGVFLVRSAPVRVLMYGEKTSLASRTGILDAIQRSAATFGRGYAVSQTTASQLTLQLSQADVLVIGPQQDASDAELHELGTAWSFALRTFLRRGGVVLLFDASSTSNAGTYQVLGVDGANLVQITGITLPFASRRLDLLTLSDAIAAGVPDAYQSEGSTVAFDTSALFPSAVEVVEDPVSMRPVVIHVAPVR